jgi:ATP-dependent DNA helicase DinG
VNPVGPVEHFLAAALEQLRARTLASENDLGMECPIRPLEPHVREAAATAGAALAAVEAPLLALAKSLEDLLDDEAAELPTGDRARIEGALRGLDRRARMTLPAWRSMLQGLQDDPDGEGDPDFVDWFSATVAYGRVMDAALRRHWVDPTAPLAAAVLAPPTAC